MARTSAAAVKGVLVDDYGPREDGSLPDLSPFIATAAVWVDGISSRADAAAITVADTHLEILERWLAAFAFKQSDRAVSFTTIGKSQTTFDGKTDMNFNANMYGQTAMMLDPTGYLAAIQEEAAGGGRKPVTLFWGGKRRSQQTPYEQRS